MDNVRTPDNAIRVQNRLHMGSGHGWAGVNFVLWNVQVRRVVLHSPLIGENWAIGALGEKRRPTFAREGAYRNLTPDAHIDAHGLDHPPEWGFDERGDRNWDAHGRPVRPVSLYLKQLEQRLGAEAVDHHRHRPYSFEDDRAGGS